MNEAIKDRIGRFLQEVRQSLDSAVTDAELLAELSRRAYDQARIREGLELLALAEGRQQQMRGEHAEYAAAEAMLAELWERADKAYMELVKLTRIAIPETDVDARQRLGIIGERRRTLLPFIAQAQSFYDVVINSEELQGRLARVGITREELDAGYELLRQLINANVTRNQEKGEAHAATRARDEAVDAMADWYSDFVAVARILFADRPEQLTKLGIRA